MIIAQQPVRLIEPVLPEQRRAGGGRGQAGIAVHWQIGGIKDPLQCIFFVKCFGEVHDMEVGFGTGPNDHLGTLSCRGKGGRMAIECDFFPAAGALHCDLPHGFQDGAPLFVGRQKGQAGFTGQLDVDRKPVCQKPQLLHQLGGCAGDGLGVDVTAEMMLPPQDAERFDHAFHGMIGGAEDRAGKKQPFNIISAVKADGELRQFPRLKGGTGNIVGFAIDAVAAIIAAGIGIEHFQKRNAPSVRRKGMADARVFAAAQAARLPGPVHTAGRAGHIVLGAVGQNFQFIRQFHLCGLQKGIRNTPHRLERTAKPRITAAWEQKRDKPDLPSAGSGSCIQIMGRLFWYD